MAERKADIHEKGPMIRGYLNCGIDMIRQKRYLSAYKYLSTINTGIMTPGMCGPIKQLLTEEDLEWAVSRFAHFFNASEMGSWYVDYPGSKKELADFPDRFDTGLSERFYYEMSLLALEEWIHRLQAATGPLNGIDDPEVDVASYLEEAGFYLSDNFLTRYEARVKWCIQSHPEREPELMNFSRKYGR